MRFALADSAETVVAFAAVVVAVVFVSAFFRLRNPEKKVKILGRHNFGIFCFRFQENYVPNSLCIL